MRFFTTLTLLAAAAGTGLTPLAARAQQIIGYGADGPIVLVAPDGRILDRPPEYGSVQVYFDRQGRKVLVDDRGDLVATEMPLRTVRGDRGYGGGRDTRGYGYDDRGYDGSDAGVARNLPRQTDGGSVQRMDLPPAGGRDQASLDAPGMDTGAIPSGPADGYGGGSDGAPGEAQPMPGALADPAGGDLPAQHLPKSLASRSKRAQIAAVEVLLDRLGISPGVIDGGIGSNVEKALATYTSQTGQRIDPTDTAAIAQRLQETGGPAFMSYTITPQDAAGPYVASIPEDYSKKAQLDSMGYTSTAEMLAERFHMDESYLKSLNPGVDFSRPGTVITVADHGPDMKGQVAYIIADKRHAQVRGYDADNRLLVAYPATIGSTDTPSPSGTVTVERIAKNPDYTYNPKINFTQGNNRKVLRIPPGPNGPVGNMWIALSKPTYGIHGTPEPSMIGKSNSHGCVRLTNWDANELARLIKPGVTVQFID